MSEIEFYKMYEQKYNPLPIYPKLFVMKRSQLGNYINEYIKFLYYMYEDDFDEEVYWDIIDSLDKKWKFLEKKLIHYMVEGKLNIQFIKELANLNLKNPLMIIENDF